MNYLSMEAKMKNLDDEEKRITCNDCVFKFNELLGNPSPCNCCIRMSEFVPIDEESYNEGFWLDDPIVVNKILDSIDDICYKTEALDTILQGRGIEQRANDYIYYIRSLKESIVETYLANKDSLTAYEPCYGLGTKPECKTCTESHVGGACQCPF